MCCSPWSGLSGGRIASPITTQLTPLPEENEGETEETEEDEGDSEQLASGVGYRS